MVLSTIAPQRSGLITQKHPFLSFFIAGYIVVEFMQFIDRFYELLESIKRIMIKSDFYIHSLSNFSVHPF